jgi:hypothetical protein
VPWCTDLRSPSAALTRAIGLQNGERVEPRGRTARWNIAKMSTEEKDEAMEHGAEIEHVKSHGHEDESAHKTAIHRAKAATDKEHRMSLWTGIKTYPKAIGWSMIISLCIAMEAFDLCLLNTFCTGLPFAFRADELTSSRRCSSIPRTIRRAAIRR